MIAGESILFKPRKGTPMQGVYVGEASLPGYVRVKLARDPFPVDVKKSQVSACDENGKPVKSNKKVRKDRATRDRRERNMATTTADKPSAKELRKQAQGLGIKGYEDMSRKELAAAVKAAGKNGTKAKGTKGVSKVSKAEAEAAAVDRAAAKKGKGSAAKAKAAAKPAKSAPAKSSGKAAEGDGTNPFRKGSNLFHIAELLIKGGKREKLAEKLAAKVALHPYSNQGDTTVADYDKRITLGAQTLRDKHGFTIEKDGRGLSGTIKAVPPTGKKAKAKK